MSFVFFFVKYTATTEIYTYGHTLSLHDARPILFVRGRIHGCLCNCKRRARCTGLGDSPRRPLGETGKACIERRPVSQETCRRGVAQCLRSRDRPRHGSPVRATKISGAVPVGAAPERSEEHTSELQSLMRISYAVFCLKKK